MLVRIDRRQQVFLLVLRAGGSAGNDIQPTDI